MSARLRFEDRRGAVVVAFELSARAVACPHPCDRAVAFFRLVFCGCCGARCAVVGWLDGSEVRHALSGMGPNAEPRFIGPVELVPHGPHPRNVDPYVSSGLKALIDADRRSNSGP